MCDKISHSDGEIITISVYDERPLHYVLCQKYIYWQTHDTTMVHINLKIKFENPCHTCFVAAEII